MKVHYDQCPVCGSRKINPILQVKDHSVSGETFAVWQCADCALRFTQDVPDENSIGPYYASSAYISHSNTKTGLVNQLYQRVRNYTLQQKAGFVAKHTVEKGRLLDMGAGIGAFLQTMKNKGWEITGIEPDAGAREQAASLYGLQLNETSLLGRLEPGTFDAITLWHVLEHVHQLHPYMEKLKGLLKKDGRIFIAVPNYQSGDEQSYGPYWAAYDVPRHLYHFSPGSIEVLTQRHGMKLVEKKPMWFDSFYISLLSSKYRYGRTSWIGAPWNGLRSNLRALANSDKASSIIYVIGK